MELSDIVGDKVDDAHHSNNWVISGKHTTTGKPMLANDPHLGTSLPSFWTLNEVRWEDKWLIGASAPGIPLIGIGRGPNTSFGQTSPLSDNSDLWQETLDASLTKYFVDGEWRNLELRKEVFKVKGAADVEYIVRSTHRGPIFQPEVMANGGVLFGSGMPKTIEFDGYYSHMWGGMFPGD
jgi:penicillin G amidase